MPERGEHQNYTPHVNNRPRDLTEVSRTVLRSEQAKRWTKRYRTEVAASSSSLLSTFVAVSYPGNSRHTGPTPVLTAPSILSTLSRPVCRRMHITLHPNSRRSLTRHSYKFNSFTDCVRHTYRTEGFHGFYRGTYTH